MRNWTQGTPWWHQLLRRTARAEVSAMRTTWPVVCTFLILVVSSAAVGEPSRLPRHLTFEERVAAQRAIEQVYWNHRIWPEGNPMSKPPLSAVLSDATLRGTVVRSLEESNALDQVWRRPISASQLQAELDRMVKSTRAPDV